MEKKQAALPPVIALGEKDAKTLAKAQKDVLGKLKILRLSLGRQQVCAVYTMQILSFVPS